MQGVTCMCGSSGNLVNGRTNTCQDTEKQWHKDCLENNVGRQCVRGVDTSKNAQLGPTSHERATIIPGKQEYLLWLSSDHILWYHWSINSQSSSTTSHFT